MNSIPLLLIMTLLGSVGAVFFKYISTYLNEKDKASAYLLCGWRPFLRGGSSA
ncbi:hypothetical protein MUB15_22080 [Priestia sp. OVS21]|nr:hypothetical protein [Priestia sp. OVS21]